MILILQYLILIAYIWIPLKDLSWSILVIFFFNGVMDYLMRNSLVRLVYLIDESKRWILSAAHGIALVAGALFQLNQATANVDSFDEGYSSTGIISRVVFTVICILIPLNGIYNTHKLQ